jgi:hypothetical protein
MTISDWIMILAVLIGPICAVRLTRHLDNKKEIRERKLEIFKTLMATRSYSVSWDHVVALNRIDLEFAKNKKDERDVVNAWKAYHDLLSDKTIPFEQWSTKRLDLFVDLLHTMAKVLDYDFDKTHIKNSAYSPIAHESIEAEKKAIRAGLIELLEGRKSIPMNIVNSPSNK